MTSVDISFLSGHFLNIGCFNVQPSKWIVGVHYGCVSSSSSVASALSSGWQSVRPVTSCGNPSNSKGNRENNFMSQRNLLSLFPQPRMDQYFNQMEKIVKERKTSSRIRFMLQDIVDQRLVSVWVCDACLCSAQLWFTMRFVTLISLTSCNLILSILL